MRRWVPLVLLLCATPAVAQTRWIVGNTLIDVPPGVVVADAGKGYGKGHGRGGGAPAPSPAPAVSAPAPAPQPAGEMGRGEASFQPYYSAGSVTITPAQAPVYAQQLPYAPAPPMPQYRAEPTCPECATTVTVPIQLHLRASVQALTAIQPQASYQSQAQPQSCPTGCVSPSAVQSPSPSQPQPLIMRQRVCNSFGQCILWP